ncbi:hypothetical protein VP504_02980 [Grimontia sp. NTOU-MAR1]|nr:hypothetical protein [Grimontia sp. NTOU-MAR1]WRV98416.1 hypothetical protein VP504_02980 [Grimontia sp. NTOU-MAR1]
MTHLSGNPTRVGILGQHPTGKRMTGLIEYTAPDTCALDATIPKLGDPTGHVVIY